LKRGNGNRRGERQIDKEGSLAGLGGERSEREKKQEESVKEELRSCKMGKCDENGSGMGEAMQLAAAKQQYAEHMDSLRAEVGNFTYCMRNSLPSTTDPKLSLSS
jgi:hypothetical protein